MSPAWHGVVDSICNFWKKFGAPPPLTAQYLQDWIEQPAMSEELPLPPASFTLAKTRRDGVTRPQAIAHRGDKTNHPENTMRSMRAAVQLGVHALETDIHLSKDGVPVLSHDASLKRCYGVNRRVIDCDWKYLSELRTLQAPHEPMPRLEDLFRYMAQPEVAHVWVLLDIKLHNDSDSVFKYMAAALSKVEPAPGTRWQDRIILGCWAAKQVPYCQKHFPGFPITNITLSTTHARQFFKIPNVSFNIGYPVLISPWGPRFIRSAKSRGRAVYAWTVNEVEVMEWCIRHELDGIISDDPAKLLKTIDEFDPDARRRPWRREQLIRIFKFNLFIAMFSGIFLLVK